MSQRKRKNSEYVMKASKSCSRKEHSIRIFFIVHLPRLPAERVFLFNYAFDKTVTKILSSTWTLP